MINLLQLSFLSWPHLINFQNNLISRGFISTGLLANYRQMKYLPLFIAVVISFITACTGKERITHPEDYNEFLKPAIIEREANQVQQQISFWEKRLQKDTGNFVNMMVLANCRLRLFKLRGEVTDLRLGDSLMKRSSAKLLHKDPDILFAISQNSITQHQFKQANYYNEAAGKAGGDGYTKSLLEFDARMELGETIIASRKIESLKDKSSFDYLIRKSKLEDQNGNPGKAIEIMEQAFEKIKNGKKMLYCWTLSKLADLYGHAGRVDEAYRAYLKVLNKDNGYVHALKGIAWIAFSHDGDTKEATRICQYIQSQVVVPELFLVLGEIEEGQGHPQKKKVNIDQFIRQVDNVAYDGMYNKYLIQLYTDEVKEPEKALLLAEKEVENRATPETYDWLAWACYNTGDLQKAYIIANNYVYKRNFEPPALLHTALIFLAAGKKELAKKLLTESLESAFELGPVKAKYIRQEIKKLM